MRISDWSSDVCSSDLRRQETLPQGFLVGFADRGQWNAVDDLDAFRRLHRPFALTDIGGQVADRDTAVPRHHGGDDDLAPMIVGHAEAAGGGNAGMRSESILHDKDRKSAE